MSPVEGPSREARSAKVEAWRRGGGVCRASRTCLAGTLLPLLLVLFLWQGVAVNGTDDTGTTLPEDALCSLPALANHLLVAASHWRDESLTPEAEASPHAGGAGAAQYLVKSVRRVNLCLKVPCWSVLHVHWNNILGVAWPLNRPLQTPVCPAFASAG